jgi:uncharacterized protein YyaL (SSP411 family)
MEHESFENEATAAIMNEHFINIKIDREERPDIDHIYMDAVQAMTGSGGWPLNVFLTPELKPFYGGPYYPPTKAYNRSSWTDVLYAIQNAWAERKNELEAQAEELTAHLTKTNTFGEAEIDNNKTNKENLILINNNILKTADTTDGGFGAAPKFPQFHSITYLLRHFHFFNDKKSLEQATLSLQKMINGGIYDQLGGGLARYSTDTVWLVPHFEKMLYDNALFTQTLAEAYSITKQENFLTALQETIAFVERDLMHSNFLFYAAIDADSEGIEGKYYCWTIDELKEELSNEEVSVFAAFYNVTADGNFTEPHHNITSNILHKTKTIAAFANELNTEEAILQNSITIAKQKLLAKRYKRIPPLTDDKCILGWNALMNKALVKAYEATGNKHYVELAEKNWSAIIENFIVQKESNTIKTIYHTYKNNKATINAFLDDLAYLADAALHLYNVTLKQEYKNYLQQFLTYINTYFLDDNSPFYFFTNKTQTDIIVRKKEVYDGATPSANSILASVLFDAAILFDKMDWQEKANKMLNNLSNAIQKHPNSFAIWATLAQKDFFGVNEISIKDNSNINEITPFYIPYKLIKNNLELKETQWMLCKNQVCMQPTDSFATMYKQLNALNVLLSEK